MKMWKSLNDEKKPGGPLMRILMRGFFFSLPAALTIWAISFAFGVADTWLGEPVAALVRLVLPEAWLVGPLASGHIPGLSFIMLVALLWIIGAVASWKWGEKLMRNVDHIFVNLPVAGTIYRGTRKVGDLLGGPSNLPFQRVVLIPFIGPGCYTVAFVTGTTRDKSTGRVYLRVAIPTPPNPLSSLPAIVPEEMAVDAGMTVEEGLQYCLSLGMVGPAEMLFPPAGAAGANGPVVTGARETAPTLPPQGTSGGDGHN